MAKFEIKNKANFQRECEVHLFVDCEGVYDKQVSWLLIYLFEVFWALLHFNIIAINKTDEQDSWLFIYLFIFYLTQEKEIDQISHVVAGTSENIISGNEQIREVSF